MDGSVRALELQFQKVEQELQYVSLKLEHELEARRAGAQTSARADVSPAHVLARLRRLLADVPQLERDAMRIVDAKRTLAGLTMQQLLESRQVLEHVAAVGAVPPTHDGSSESLQDLECTRSLLMEQLASTAGAGAGAAANASASASANANAAGAPAQLSTAPQAAEQQQTLADGRAGEPTASSALAAPQTPAAKRAATQRKAGRFVAVTAEEFAQLPALLSKRISVDDLNAVYRAVYDAHSHALGGGGAVDALVELKALQAGGVTVTGQTGKSKIDALRMLGVLKVHRDGVALAYAPRVALQARGRGN